MSWTIRCLWGCWKLDVKNKSIRSFVWQLTLFLMEKKNNDPPTNTSPFPKQQQQKLKQTNKTATTENPGSSTLWFSCFKTYRGTNLFFFSLLRQITFTRSWSPLAFAAWLGALREVLGACWWISSGHWCLQMLLSCHKWLRDGVTTPEAPQEPINTASG